MEDVILTVVLFLSLIPVAVKFIRNIVRQVKIDLLQIEANVLYGIIYDLERRLVEITETDSPSESSSSTR